MSSRNMPLSSTVLNLGLNSGNHHFMKLTARKSLGRSAGWRRTSGQGEKEAEQRRSLADLVE